MHSLETFGNDHCLESLSGGCSLTMPPASTDTFLRQRTVKQPSSGKLAVLKRESEFYTDNCAFNVITEIFSLFFFR